jgi:hypothetical protein
MITKEFILAGHAIFTVQPTAQYVAEHAKARTLVGGIIIAGCRPHYTYKVMFAKKANGSEDNEIRFAMLLNGSDNESNYRYLAVLNVENGSIFSGQKYRHKEFTYGFIILRHVLKAIWEGRSEEIERNGWQVHHAGRCCRCGRMLTTPESLESGFGPECRKYQASGFAMSATN